MVNLRFLEQSSSRTCSWDTAAQHRHGEIWRSLAGMLYVNLTSRSGYRGLGR